MHHANHDIAAALILRAHGVADVSPEIEGGRNDYRR